MNKGITINANEVRIGNYVMLDTGHTLPMPHAILPDDLMRLWKHDFPDNIIIEPIPLSPSILEKCGFKYGVVEGIAIIDDTYNAVDEEGDTEYWDLGKITIVRWGKKEFILSHKSSFDHRIEIKSLHQLQNIYYALTQIELKIQLQP